MFALLSILAQSDSEAVLADPLTSGDWIRAGAIFVGALVAAFAISRVLRRVMEHALGPGFAAILTARFVGYGVALLGVFYALTELGVRVGPLIGALGLGGLVLALALQRVVENFVAALILQTGRPYTIGETVQLDGHVGVVADIDSRTTLLIGLDGVHVRIPNANVVASTIMNLTREPLRRSTLTVGVAYATNLAATTDVLRSAIARVPRIKTEPAPAISLQQFGESSIDFDIMYWHDSDVPSELATRHDLMVAIHQAFDAEDITIAFPQLTLWNGHNPTDGPYDRYAEEIRTPYPGLDTPVPARRRPGPRLLPRRSRPTDPAGE